MLDHYGEVVNILLVQVTKLLVKSVKLDLQ